MTGRTFAFPRIDVREAPARAAPYSGMFALPTWREDWSTATARARAIYAIPSRYPMVAPSLRLVESLTEGRRKRERFEP